MFHFDRTDLQRMTVAALGALILSATFVGAAVAPARAVEMAPIAGVQTDLAAAYV